MELARQAGHTEHNVDTNTPLTSDPEANTGPSAELDTEIKHDRVGLDLGTGPGDVRTKAFQPKPRRRKQCDEDVDTATVYDFKTPGVRSF